MLSGGGEYHDFLVDSKSIILRTRYRSEAGQLFARRYDPLGCVWGAARSEKYLHPPGTPLEKKIAKKSQFLGTTVLGTFFDPDDLLRSKMVLNMFFGPLTISYDAWMMSHTKLKKLILRLKIGPKMTLGPFFP